MPESVAFAGVNQLKGELQGNAQSTQRKQAVFALLIVSVAVCAVVIFVGTITRPLNQMRDRIFNLSSADGDLTQVLNVKTIGSLLK